MRVRQLIWPVVVIELGGHCGAPALLSFCLYHAWCFVSIIYVREYSRHTRKTKFSCLVVASRAAADIIRSTYLVESLVDGVHYSLLAADHALDHTRVGLHRLIEERPHRCLCKRFRSWRTENSPKSKR